MKRKTFIYLSVAGAATLVTPIAGCRNYSDSLLHTLGQPDFLGHLCDANTIADIGKAYRTAVPEESHTSDLIRLLLKDIPGAQDAPNLPQWLSRRVRNDFETENTVTVKGWVLSRTEARQCAVFSLHQQ